MLSLRSVPDLSTGICVLNLWPALRARHRPITEVIFITYFWLLLSYICFYPFYCYQWIFASHTGSGAVNFNDVFVFCVIFWDTCLNPSTSPVPRYRGHLHDVRTSIDDEVFVVFVSLRARPFIDFNILASSSWTSNDSSTSYALSPCHDERVQRPCVLQRPNPEYCQC